MSIRLTGNAATKAIAKPMASDHQKRKSESPAAIAPGTRRMKALSTISMTAIETVSAASATRAALRNGSPARLSGNKVSE
jgi:hypothetical protein